MLSKEPSSSAGRTSCSRAAPVLRRPFPILTFNIPKYLSLDEAFHGTKREAQSELARLVTAVKSGNFIDILLAQLATYVGLAEREGFEPSERLRALAFNNQDDCEEVMDKMPKNEGINCVAFGAISSSSRTTTNEQRTSAGAEISAVRDWQRRGLEYPTQSAG